MRSGHSLAIVLFGANLHPSLLVGKPWAGGAGSLGEVTERKCPVDLYMQEGSWVTTGLRMAAHIGQVLARLGLFTGKWFPQDEEVKCWCHLHGHTSRAPSH